MNAAIKYCEEKLKPLGMQFHYSLLNTPQRPLLLALHALNKELNDIANIEEPIVAQQKLAWWHEELIALEKGKPRHPVTTLLKPAVESDLLPPSLFQGMIEGITYKLNHHTCSNFKAFALLSQQTLGNTFLLIAHINGFKDHATLQFINNLALSLNITSLIKRFREEAHHGRCYFPETDLSHFDVSNELITSMEPHANIKALLNFEAAQALRYYNKALEKLPSEDRKTQRHLLKLAKLNMAQLEEIKKDGFQVLTHQIELTPLRQCWLAWRAK